MPELSTQELHRYRQHVVPREIHAYKALVRSIEEKGILEPIELLTDGRYVVLREGHKRVEAARQLGIRTVPVTILRKRFGPKRRYKWPIGPGVADLLAAQEAPPKAEPVSRQKATKSTAKVKRAPAKTRVNSSSSTRAKVRG